MKRFVAVSLLATSVIGCQDYNFNPVGHCIVQPISKEITLSNTNTADVLWVIDDSNSMNPRQQNLAANFSGFSDYLKQYNADRVSKGLDPAEFHMAVTTSSIFRNYMNGGSCGSATANQCCDSSSSGNNPACHACQSWQSTTNPLPGSICGDYAEHFEAPLITGCQNPSDIAAAGAMYPQGNFVSKPGNPKVIHLTKDLFQPGNSAALDGWLAKFKQNLFVGSCGSGEEQHLEAARMAIEKMQAGQQCADYPTGCTQTLGNDEFLHKNAKLVVVIVGDEDDCSSPKDRDNAIPLEPPVANSPMQGYWDSCMYLETTDPDPHTSVTDIANFFNGLPVSDFAVGLIDSVADGSCKDAGNGSVICQPGLCTAQSCPTGGNCPDTYVNGCLCSGVSPANRQSAFANLIHNAGHQVVQGPICDSNFSATLQAIAKIVVPVDKLHLGSTPAGMDIAQLRIIGTDGKTRKICKGPATDATQIDPSTPAAQQYDWYFVDGSGNFVNSPQPDIKINHNSGGCEANPGESYRFEALGTVAPCTVEHDCTVAMGGADTDWSCENNQCHCKGQ